ncbi:MAG: Thioredoxin [candidate division TM6 bacterium GW2011_GWF2_38_10]|nr:MAG: Thioredoxin [candidate division TM6 bacterium GW2011_GWF2_38_10]
MNTKKLCLLCLSLAAPLSGCKCPFNGCQADKKVIEKINADVKELSEKQSAKESSEAISEEKITPIAIISKQAFEKEVLQSTLPVIVDFSAEWCGACKASLPALNAAAQELATTHKFVTINTDDAAELAQEYGIRGIPTFIFFKDGKEVTRKVGGITQKDAFIKVINETFEQK